MVKSTSKRPLVRIALLAATLLVGWACSTDPLAPPPAPVTPPAPAAREVGDFNTRSNTTVTTAVNTLRLMHCSAQPHVVASQVIGPRGGSINFGAHRLYIPSGALTANTLITAEAVSDSVNSVHFEPHGLTFLRKARLRLDYSNCKPILPGIRHRVVYTNDFLQLLENVLSADYPEYEYTDGEISHFSRYAVAW